MEKKKISVSQVIEMIEKGMKRHEIKEQLGIKGRDAQLLFSHPAIKGKKAKSVYEPAIEIVDDLEAEAEMTTPEDQQLEEVPAENPEVEQEQEDPLFS